MQSPVKFNNSSMKDISSHSTTLFNNRLAILFVYRDEYFVKMFSDGDSIKHIKDSYSIDKMIYLNIRPLIYNHPVLRNVLNLDTNKRGVYVTDIAFSLIEKMIEFGDAKGYDRQKLYVIRKTLEQVDQICMNVLQFLNYFIRPNIKNKPDVMEIAQVYKQKADKLTIEEIQRFVGRSDSNELVQYSDAEADISKFDELEYDNDEDDDDPGYEDETREFGDYKPGTLES